MSSINQVIGELINKHRNNTPALIQEIFNILPSISLNDRKVAQSAILFAMESLHEWQNIAFFVEKWQHTDFRREFIRRMRKRIDEEHDNEMNINSKEEMTKLIDKYWRNVSPRKQENKYFDPELHSINEESHSNFSRPHSQTPEFKQRQLFKSQQAQSQPLPGQPGRKSQIPNNLTSLTGRPAILKKSTIMDMKQRIQTGNKKGSEDSQSEVSKVKSIQSLSQISQKAQLEEKSKHSDTNSEKGPIYSDTSRPKPELFPKSNAIKVISEKINKPIDKGSIKDLINRRMTAHEIKEEPQQSYHHRPGDEPFPSTQDNFKFGSGQKQKAEDNRRKTVSPIRKMDISNKKVVIKRQIPKDYDESQGNDISARYLQDFSFMDSGAKFNKHQHQPQNQFKHQNQNNIHNNNIFPLHQQKNTNPPSKFEEPAFSFTTEKVTKHSYLNQNEVRNLIDIDNSHYTPVFEPLRNKQQTFLTSQEMKLVNPEYKPLYMYHYTMARCGYSFGKMMEDGLEKWKQNWRPYNGKKR